MAVDLASEVIGDWERGNDDRGIWMSHWQRIANFLLPNRADYITERAPGSRRTQYIFTSAPLTMVDQCASGLHSYLTSPYLPWFALEPEEAALAGRWRVQRWFDLATLAMYQYFNLPRHNFASQSYELYLDLVTIGTASMPVLESPRDGIFFSTRHMREIVVFENEEDRVDQVSRKWQWTAKQAVEAWGAAAGEKIVKCYEDGREPKKKFWFHHRVKPRNALNPARGDRRNMAFESVYVSEEDKAVIAVGGFREFPYLIPRFSKASGENYGRGPGMLQLPDVQMLNEFVKLIWKAAQKVIDPPLMLPDDGFIVPIKTSPGSFNYYRAGTRPTDRIAPIETHGNIELGMELLNGLLAQLRAGFYVDYLMMPADPRDPAASGKGVTATYVLQQRDEKMRLLSPMLARLQAEFLEPLINRVFALLWRRSALLKFGRNSPFPAPPPEIAGRAFRARYISPIAIAQRSSSLDTVGRLMQTQLELRQMDPTTPMVLDPQAIMRLEARDMNAPTEVLKSPEKLALEFQAAARMQQQQHEAEVAKNVAGAAQQGANALGTVSQLAAPPGARMAA